MSSATSQRGKEFEGNFIAGFQRQNSHLTVHFSHGFQVTSNVSRKTVGDIDYFVKLPADIADIRLEDVMPPGANVHEPGFVLEAGDNLFFELTAQKGSLIYVSDGTTPSYIEKKVGFHAQIQRGETDFQYPNGSSTATSGRAVLILVFNGADSAGVRPHFQSCLAGLGGVVVGSSVFASFESISNWVITVQLRETEAARLEAQAARRAEREARIAEQATSLDAQDRAQEERTARLALEAELARLVSDRK